MPATWLQALNGDSAYRLGCCRGACRRATVRCLRQLDSVYEPSGVDYFFGRRLCLVRGTDRRDCFELVGGPPLPRFFSNNRGPLCGSAGTWDGIWAHGMSTVGRRGLGLALETALGDGLSKSYCGMGARDRVETRRSRKPRIRLFPGCSRPSYSHL